MKIKDFGVEIWMDTYENHCKYNIAETCVDSISLHELERFALREGDLLSQMYDMRLGYGEIPGRKAFREGVAGLYRTVSPDQVLTTNGAAGANFLAHYALLEPGDEIIVVVPTYQQHYSIPESLGAHVKTIALQKNLGFSLDLEELKEMTTSKTKFICINNPNNPTGALMDEATLTRIVEIARAVGAYILCDEVYRYMSHDGAYQESIVDLYEKGISTGSMSKVFSLAGLRLGWIVGPKEVIDKAYGVRHYSIISVGMLDELVGAFALKYKDAILRRNQKIVCENSKLLDAWIRDEPRMNYIRPAAGTIALLYYDMNISSTDFCKRLLEDTGVLLTPGDCFDMGQCVRIGYAYNQSQLQNGLSALTAYLRQYDNGHA